VDRCPGCGLVVAFSWAEGEAPPPDTPTCNPINSPECWRIIGRSTRPDEHGRKRLLRLALPGDDA
jgi:hypothetical protein